MSGSTSRHAITHRAEPPPACGAASFVGAGSRGCLLRTWYDLSLQRVCARIDVEQRDIGSLLRLAPRLRCVPPLAGLGNLRRFGLHRS